MRTVTYTTTVNHRRPPAHQTVRPRVHGSRPPRRVVQRLDRDTWVHDASELKYAPRYLNECTCLRYTPATVTCIGVKSSSTFITSVFFTFIRILISPAAQFSLVTSSCNSASLLAINTMSSAYRRFVISLPPIPNPPSKPSRAFA